MRALIEIGSYSVGDWEKDRALQSGVRLRCPSCETDVPFGPYEHPRGDGSLRRYRGCKMCGFWQEADGRSPPFRCVLTVHACVGWIPDSQQCSCCPQRGPADWHLCPRVLTEAEVRDESYTCAISGAVVRDAHVIPWGIEAP